MSIELKMEVDETDTPFLRLGGDYMMRLDLEELDEENKERAVLELRETPQNVEKALKVIKELIEDEPGLDLPLDDDSFLLKFLRPCKYYPHSAFKLLKRFYIFKLKHPKYCDNLTPAPLRHVFDKEVFMFLPTRTSSGSRIMIINAGTKWNPKEVELTDLFRATMLSIEIAMIEPQTQLGGVYVIIDCKGLSLNHVYQFSPSIAKLMVDWIQECVPVRLKGIHIINQPLIFSILWTLFKPLMGEKLRKRIYFHGSNKKSLTDNICPKSLPPYLGGTAEYQEFPGSMFSDMICYAEKKFEPCNIYGYKKNKVETED